MLAWSIEIAPRSCVLDAATLDKASRCGID
jgi:hypothetical protein